MSDRVDDVTKKLAKTGIAQVPVFGVIFEAATAFLPPNADERLKAAIEQDLADTLASLQSKVERLAVELEAKSAKLEELGALRTFTLAREAAASAAEARTAEKRESVLNATARQFDPEAGTPATRDFWLQRVRSLPDVELKLVLLIAKYKRLAFQNNDLVQLVEDRIRPLPLPREDLVAFRTVAASMINAQLGGLIIRHTSREIPFKEGTYTTIWPIDLTEDGQVLVSYALERQ